jgi:hypothetical protein
MPDTTPIAPEVEARVRELVASGVSRAAVAQQLGIGKTSVYRIAPAGKPQMGGGARTVKAAIVDVLRETPGLDTREVARRLSHLDEGRWRTMGTHSIQHVLHSMVKQNVLTGRVSRDGRIKMLVDLRVVETRETSVALPLDAARIPDLTRIRPPEVENRQTGSHPAGYSRGRHAVGRDYTDPWRHGTRAQGGPVERTRSAIPPVAESIVTPEPTPSPWPVLAELRARREANGRGVADAARLLDAAAQIEDVWPEKSRELEQRANDLAAAASMTEAEIEYLRFADEHDE